MLTFSLRSFSNELSKIAQSKREKELYRAVEKESPVEVRQKEEAKLYGGGYFETGDDSHIGVAEKNHQTLAHEVGHAKNHEKLWGKIIQSNPSAIAYGLAPALGIAAGLALAERGKKWPLLLPALAAAPILAAEGLATREGGKVLETAKAKPEELEKYRSKLHRDFTSYLQAPAQAAALGAMTYFLATALKKS